MKTLTQAELKHVLNFDPATGLWTWRNPPGKRLKPGAEAGCLNVDGKWQIGFGGVRYLASKLAALYVHGTPIAESTRAYVRPPDVATLAANLATLKAELAAREQTPVTSTDARAMTIKRAGEIEQLEAELARQTAREAALRRFQSDLKGLRQEYRHELEEIDAEYKESRAELREFQQMAREALEDLRT